MTLIFKPENHSYTSIDPADDIQWISATTLVSQFKQPFDGPAIAKKCSNNPKSKWYGMESEKILQLWEREARRADTLGSWYHDQRERDLVSFGTIALAGTPTPVIKPIMIDGVKHAPNQGLEGGLYPEHFVFLRSAGLCGQSDLVEMANGEVNITDYKTNKKIDTESYRDWQGISKKMLPPVSHLDDCNINHYALQLSIYMYMILKHNHRLKPGKLVLHLVIFEKERDDEYGFPISLLDANGEPVVKEVIRYEVPYLRDEVRQMIGWLKDNRDKLRSK